MYPKPMLGNLFRHHTEQIKLHYIDTFTSFHENTCNWFNLVMSEGKGVIFHHKQIANTSRVKTLLNVMWLRFV